MIILKGHLLLEGELFRLIAKNVKYPDAIAIHGASFHTLLTFAKALKYENDFDWLWKSIDKLNSIRNDLAHKLEPKQLSQKLNDFFSLIDPDLLHMDRGGADSRTEGSFACRNLSPL